MGSADSKSLKVNANEKLVNVKTADLKERLNRVYTDIRGDARANLGRFDYLWDLKELALMEGRQSVDVPETWLKEVEKGIEHGQRGH